jgi:hypothetical protein
MTCSLIFQLNLLLSSTCTMKMEALYSTETLVLNHYIKSCHNQNGHSVTEKAHSCGNDSRLTSIVQVSIPDRNTLSSD